MAGPEDPTRIVPTFPPTLPLGSAPDRPGEPGPADWPPDQARSIGGFLLGRELGRGGCGVVYLAMDPRTKRLVALKIPGLAAVWTAEMCRRFAREAEALARLDHPHIVPVYEASAAEGAAYLAMAYCPGPTLAEWLARRAGPVPVAQAVWLVSVLADAVQHAHEHGIIHRDLKPGNILLFPARPGVPADAPLEAEWFTPRVADFGVARLLDAGDRTRTGQVVGTLAYMAPEQADGDGSRVGPAADVYSLGVILYELLTGEKPFAAAGPEAVLARVLRAEPRPPRAARREIPPDLEAVCLKCLEKDPRRRYPSAAALAEDLRRFRSGLPTRARPEGPLRRAWRAVRRRPALAGMAALTGLALLAVLAVGARYSVRLIRTERALHAAREVARAQEFFALLEKVRQRRVEPYPGWADDSLADLARLAAMQPAAAYLPELRSEAASCLRAVGLTPLRALAEGFPTYSLAFSPDGETLALGGWYGGPYRVTRLRLVEAGSGRVLRELSYTADAEWEDATQRADACAALAFGPGGRPLAAGTRSARVFVWDLTRPGDPPLRLAGHTRSLGVSDTVRELVFDAERPVLFSSGGHELIGWDLDSPGREVLRLPGARLPRGVSLARGALAVWRGREIHLLDLATYATAPQQISWGNSLFACPVPAPGFAVGRAVALASGARLAYAANRPGDPDRPYHPFRAPEDDEADLGRIIDLAFSPDGSLLATTSAAQRLKLWSPLNLRPLAERPTGDGSLRLAFHPGGRRLAVADENRVVLYALPGRGVETAAADCGGRAFDFDASGAGTLLYADTERSDVEVAYEISFWPVRAGAAGERPFREVLPGTARNNVPLTAAAPGGGFAFTRDDGLGYWDGRSPGSVRLGGRALEEAKDIRFGPDGRLWAAAGHEVRAWRVPDGGEQVVFRNPPDDERAGLVFYAVAPGRERVLAGRRDGRLFAFDPAGGHLATWRLGESPLTALALAAGGHLAAVGGDRGELWMVNPATGEVVADLPKAHRDAVHTATFSPGGLLATGSRDRTVRLWGEDGALVLTLWLGRPVRRVRFADDGRTLTVLLEGERGLRRFHLERLHRDLSGLGIDPGWQL